MTFVIAPTVYADDEIKIWFNSPNITNFDTVAKNWLINACGSNTITYNVFVYRVKEPYITLWFERKATYIPYPIVDYDVRIYEYVPTIWNALEIYRNDTVQEAMQTIEELSIKYGLSDLPCIPNWQCRTPLDGYETDINNCGKADRYNVNCEPSCVPNWQCEVDIDGKNTGWKTDINGCYERTYDNIMCPVGEEPPEEPNNTILYLIIGTAGLIGLKLISDMKK